MEILTSVSEANASLDKYGNQATQAQIDGDQVSTNPNDANYMCPVGMSWFPGYVLDVSSGERLNLAFGEDSWLGNEGGKDMKFNLQETTLRMQELIYLVESTMYISSRMWIEMRITSTHLRMVCQLTIMVNT